MPFAFSKNKNQDRPDHILTKRDLRQVTILVEGIPSMQESPKPQVALTHITSFKLRGNLPSH